MANPNEESETDLEEVIFEQQFQRAVSSFEAIMLSQIEVKRQLTDRLNYSIRAGLIILALIAISILILLLTLSAQINRISGVVSEMNVHFSSVSNQMVQIDGYVQNMQQRVALMEAIEGQTAIMTEEMQLINGDLLPMSHTIGGISDSVKQVRDNILDISTAIDHMNANVQMMGRDMHRMGQPARSLNNMFPFP